MSCYKWIPQTAETQWWWWGGGGGRGTIMEGAPAWHIPPTIRGSGPRNRLNTVQNPETPRPLVEDLSFRKTYHFMSQVWGAKTIHKSVHVYIYVGYMNVYVCEYVHMHVYMYMYLFRYICIYIYIYIYICNICACMYINMYMFMSGQRHNCVPFDHYHGTLTNLLVNDCLNSEFSACYSHRALTYPPLM